MAVFDKEENEMTKLEQIAVTKNRGDVLKKPVATEPDLRFDLIVSYRNGQRRLYSMKPSAARLGLEYYVCLLNRRSS